MTISKYAPPPPEGFQPPPLWGCATTSPRSSPPTGAELSFTDGAAHWRFDSVHETVAEYSEKFGPIVMLRPALEADGRWEELLADLKAMYQDVNSATDGGVEFEGEYLITQGKRHGIPGLVLELQGLSKRYGDTVALDDLGFSVEAGQLFGFVGPNGAGKTTAMRIVIGVLEPDSGEVRWQGVPLDAATRSRFGYMPEERGLYPKMTVADQLAFFAELHGMTRQTAAEASDAGSSGSGWRARRRRGREALARQPATRSARRRAGPRSDRARSRRAVQRPRPGRRRRSRRGARRRRARARPAGDLLLAPARAGRAALRRGGDRLRRAALSTRAASTTLRVGARATAGAWSWRARRTDAWTCLAFGRWATACSSSTRASILNGFSTPVGRPGASCASAPTCRHSPICSATSSRRRARPESRAAPIT